MSIVTNIAAHVQSNITALVNETGGGISGVNLSPVWAIVGVVFTLIVVGIGISVSAGGNKGDVVGASKSGGVVGIGGLIIGFGMVGGLIITFGSQLARSVFGG